MDEKKIRVVIKYGGHALDDADLAMAFSENLVFLGSRGVEVAVVHGGGPQIGGMLERLGLVSRFIDGLRVTDEAVLGVVEMVLCGQVNKRLVRDFLRANVPAVGLSGMDGGMLRAEIVRPELGRVGEITAVRPEIVECLLKDNFVPVIAPLALGGDGQALNINADTAAGALAGALGADYFILISDVPGVLDAQGRLLPELDWPEIQNLCASGVISGGMLPKTRCCRAALDAGCGKAVILDGKTRSSLKKFLVDGEIYGTVIS